MPNKKPLKDPTPAQITTGYYLYKARNKIVEYLWQARECALVAAAEAKKAGDLKAVVQIQRETGAMLQVAGEAETEIADIHLRLRKRLKKAGYREISDKEFKQLGGGGPR